MSSENGVLFDKCSINFQGAGITLYIGAKHKDSILSVLPASVDDDAPMYMMEFDPEKKMIKVGVAKL